MYKRLFGRVGKGRTRTRIGVEEIAYFGRIYGEFERSLRTNGFFSKSVLVAFTPER